jgi:ribonuclease T1
MPARGVRALGSRWVVAVLMGLGLVVGAGFADAVVAREAPAPGSTVDLSALPPQAQATYRLVLAGGPFPYSKDGVVFGNREQLLPRQARGYYREYTVKTPGAKDRGARRIVCGGLPPKAPEACYYTDDHYASYRRIAP